MEDLITYEIIDVGVYKISLNNVGIIGDLIFIDNKKLWCFLPIETFFYKPVHLALILNKLNDLNNYKKEVM